MKKMRDGPSKVIVFIQMIMSQFDSMSVFYVYLYDCFSTDVIIYLRSKLCILKSTESNNFLCSLYS